MPSVNKSYIGEGTEPVYTLVPNILTAKIVPILSEAKDKTHFDTFTKY